VTRFRRITWWCVAILLLLPFTLFVLFTVDEAKARDGFRQELADVDVSDGISSVEANEIAGAYFGGYISACGGPSEGKLINGEWVIPISIGYGGRAAESPIRINAKTGGTRYEGGPTFSSFETFRFNLLWGIPLRKLSYFLSQAWAS